MAQLDEALQTRLRDLARQAARRGAAVTGRFLALAELPAAVGAAREAGVSAAWDGGWPGAERVQICFHPDGVEPVFTYVWAEARWNARFASVTHRDLLGSLMGLGMTRDCFGDLVAEEDRACVCCLPALAERLPSEWLEAGRAALRVRLLDAPPELPRPSGQTLRDTVPSLRLDAVLSAGLGKSRAAAAELIRRGAVSVNHLPEERTDRLLREGDMLSVRGFGRVRLTGVGEPTRKDRLPVTLEVFSGRG